MPKTTVIEAIEAAFGYATFKDKEVKIALVKVVTSHKNDLHDVGYEESTRTEDAIVELVTALNEIDEAVATKEVELKEAISEGREEPEE